MNASVRLVWCFLVPFGCSSNSVPQQPDHGAPGAPPTAEMVRADPQVAAQALAQVLRVPTPSPVNLVFAAEASAPLPVERLEAVVKKLNSDENLLPAVSALRAAGMSDADIATLATQAQAFNSHTPADSSQTQREVLAVRAKADLKHFVDSVNEAAATHHLAIDSGELLRRMYRLDESPTPDAKPVK